MKHIKLYENFDEYDNELKPLSNKEREILENIIQYLNENDFDFYDGEDDFKRNFIETVNRPNLSDEEKTESIVGFLDEKWGLYDGYSDVYDYVLGLF